MEDDDSNSLPIGLIETTREIFLEVASYPILPPEKIQAYWTAYTTTFRKVVDPTALRLENFWWHVWGSERRYLPGPVLARLFKEFALGPTFVPLVRQGKPHTASEPTSHQDQGSGQKSSPPDSQNENSSSSSKPPQVPRPILKKSRGPSASGPRPTARFLDPPAADEDKAGDNNDDSAVATTAVPQPTPSSTYSTNNQQVNAEIQPVDPQDISSSTAAKEELGISKEMPPPPKPSSKRRTSSTAVTVAPGMETRPSRQTSPAGGGRTTQPTNRKKVVSTVASRRRPVMPRRQSSQSTTGSPTSKTINPGAAAAVKSDRTRRPSTESKTSQESVATGSSQTSETKLSAKAAGKLPVRETSPRRVSTSSRGTSKADGQSESSGMVGQNASSGSSQQAATQSQGQPARATQVIRGFNVVSRPSSSLRVRDNVSQTDEVNSRTEAIQQPPPPPPVAGFVATDFQQRMNTGNNRRENLPQQERQMPPPRHPHSTAGPGPSQPTRPSPAPQRPPTKPGALPGARTQTSRYPPSASRAFPIPNQPQPTDLDVTHFRSRSLQRPPPSTSLITTARRRSSMDPDISRDGSQKETQTLQRPPPMAAFLPKHPAGTSQMVRIRSHIDMMAATTAAGIITTTTAEGQIASDTLTHPDTLPEANAIQDSVGFAKPKPPAVLEPKFKPTPRNPEPPVPFGRTRSELFLLLERSGSVSGKESSLRPPI